MVCVSLYGGPKAIDSILQGCYATLDVIWRSYYAASSQQKSFLIIILHLSDSEEKFYLVTLT